jgi:hypothetical protein
VRLLTVCNTGALATGGIGTALGIARVLHGQGRLAALFACETRPVLQGARLTVWEARRDGLPVTLLADAARQPAGGWRVDAVVVGATGSPPTARWSTRWQPSAAVLAARHGVPSVWPHRSRRSTSPAPADLPSRSSSAAPTRCAASPLAGHRAGGAGIQPGVRRRRRS